MAILLIEDDRLMRVTLNDALTSDGHSVCAVATLSDALTAIRTSDFDLVITDVRLPDGDGLDVIPQAFQAHAQVIVMTAYGDMKQKALVMESGAFGYVTKPFDLRILLDSVRQALGGKRAESSW